MLQVSRATRGFCFGPFELDSDSGELRNNGTPVHLQPQPTQILKILLANHGKLVTREEIQQQLWSEQTFVEFEVGLNQAIKKLREALGDSVQTPIYIETIARKGYRFIAEVQEIEDHGPGDPLLSRMLGHYRLIERIGQGGMGIVYRAHDEHLKRDVAIKILPQGAIADETSRRRFRKEALALAKLNHPNIATVTDFDSQDGIDFLVQELIPGTPMDKMLRAGPVSDKQIVELGVQLCQGLTAAHEQGVIHRDIKPANLRITPDGRLKILDFGLATVLHATTKAAAQEVTASAVETQTTPGTLPYMAPEQLLNETLDARTDIWAAGCVLYEMATGRLPFGGSGMALADAILHQSPAPPTQLNGKITPALEGHILKCLEKDPALRYRSAGEIAVDLNRLVRAPSPAPTHGGWPMWVLSVAVAMLLLTVGVAGYKTWRHIISPPTVATNSRKVVAVLYFKNMSQDPSLNWLNGGLTEMMTTNLGQVGGMEVLSTEQVSLIRKRLKYKPGQELPPEAAPEVARDAGADAYVTGTLIRLGPSRMRVDVHLQEVSTGKILFSDKIESPDLNGVFAMVDTMTSRVAERLSPPSQRPVEAPNIEQVATSNIEAFRHYQRCLDEHNKFAFDEAIPDCREAIKLDPQFALAYLELAIVQTITGDFDNAIPTLRQLEPLQARLPRIRQLEMRAWNSFLAADYEGAIAQLELMLQEAPRDVETRLRLAQWSGRWQPERGVAVLLEGARLDPKEWGYWNELTYNQSWAGNETAALEACERYEAMVGSNNPNVWSDRGDVLFFFGRYEEAITAYRKMHDLDATWEIDGTLATIYSEQGKAALVNQALRDHEKETKQVDYMLRARLLQDRGELEAADQMIRRNVQQLVQRGRAKAARESLGYFAIFSILRGGDLDDALAFVREQKIHGRELEMISLLEAAVGRERNAEEALRQFVATNPETPPLAVDFTRRENLMLLALRRGDAAAGLHAMEGHPGRFMMFRARAELLLKRYADAENSFYRAILISRSLPEPMPLLEQLAHFHLGQVYETTNRRDEAIREYQTFLSRYTPSHSRLPEIALARAALKRLSIATPRA